MHKAWALIVLLLVCRLPIHAQEEEDDPGYIEGIPTDDWEGYMPDLYARGDQTFTISMGITTPLFFLHQGNVINHNFTPPVGGTGQIVYTRFLGPHVFFGFEIGVKFHYTLQENTLFFIPIGARGGWQFIIRRFEFPLYMTVGFSPQRVLEASYTGLFLKWGGGAYYRFNPDWSFGLTTEWSWYPQWPRETNDEGNRVRVRSKDVYGNILGITLSARYHF